MALYQVFLIGSTCTTEISSYTVIIKEITTDTSKQAQSHIDARC